MKVDFSKFQQLPIRGRRLIEGWFSRAAKQQDCPDSESFEPFIYCWIAFNSWAACVTDEDRDSLIIQRLKSNPTLSARFTNLIAQEEHFARSARAFQAWWPIFKVQELRRKGIPRMESRNRREIVAHYIAAGATEYSPCNSQSPPLSGSEFPLEWNNALAVIYRVRCNLFHGDKCSSSEVVQQVVGTAFRVLVQFFGKCLNEQEFLKL
jgi:hypothetical protein